MIESLRRSTAAASALFLLAGLPACSPKASKPPPSVAAKPTSLTAYCKANGTVDAPPDSVTGPVDDAGLVPDYKVVAATKWRCAGGELLVCADTADGDQCSKKDASRDPPLLKGACDGQADTDLLPTASIHFSRFDWGCKGGKPVIVKEYALDGRGFLAKAWARMVVKDGVVVEPPQAPDVVR